MKYLAILLIAILVVGCGQLRPKVPSVPGYEVRTLADIQVLFVMLPEETTEDEDLAALTKIGNEAAKTKPALVIACLRSSQNPIQDTQGCVAPGFLFTNQPVRLTGR